MRMNRIALLALLLSWGPALTATAQPATPVQRERAITRAFDEGDLPRAARLIEAYLEDRPNDPLMLYNLACARSRLGESDKATSALYKAVQAGFRDFSHMRTDPDLEPIRGERMYKAILEAAEHVENDRAEDALARWKRTYGEDRYRYEIDDKRRLAFATALDKVSHDEMRRMLEREADQLNASLFGDPPDYYVLIAVPDPRDAQVIFGGDDSIGGRYEHLKRQLISRDIGGSLRHEFVHALHYAHMERLGLRTPHPLWLQEGLAALYEDYELSDDGSIKFLQNERSNVVKRLARIGRLTDWTDLFTMSGDRFMARPGQNYPQVRAIFEYLAEQGKLAQWYRTYVENFAEDESGVLAFERVFDRPLPEIESDWKRWAKRRPTVDNRIDYGDAALGITTDINGSNDGVQISEVLRGSAAARAGLRAGDVIVSIDGKATRSFAELRKIVGAGKVGERLAVRARRGTRYLTKVVVLQPLRH